MRVLLTTDTLGGVWTYTKELTEGLLQQSHAVALVSLGRMPSPEQSAWCSGVQHRYGEDFHHVASETPLEWMEENAVAYADARDLLLDLAKEWRADLFHSNQFCFGALPMSIPKLVVAHSDVLSWAASCRPQGLEPTSWLHRYGDLVSAGLDAADAVVAPTEWMLQALADHFALPERKQVIRNGRDLDHAPPEQRPRKLQAVTIGRLWDEAKGLSCLAGVRAPFPLFVAGEERYGTQCVPEELGEAIPLGRLEEHDLFDLLRSSAIYLALSIYEPFGLAPLEAALCGCAVVARDIPSLREVWGDAALYFEDAPALSILLERLGSHPELLSKFQGRAGRRARQSSRTRMTELYLELYHQLLKPEHAFAGGPIEAQVESRVS